MLRILTDSACDLPAQEAAALGVTVVPLHVMREDGAILTDGIDINPDEYYSYLLQCKKLPTTSQPSPETFAEHFAAAKQAGDDVLAIALSSGVSGTCQSMHIGAEIAEYADHVHIVDSLTGSLGEGLLVRHAARLRDAGLSVADIIAVLNDRIRRQHLVAVTSDLKFMRKGGRIPASVAIAGSMLGIRPLIEVKDGKIAMYGKARGLPGAYVALFKALDEDGGIDFTAEFAAACSDSLAQAEPVTRYFETQRGVSVPYIGRIGGVIGTHLGPGSFFLAWYGKNPRG